MGVIKDMTKADYKEFCGKYKVRCIKVKFPHMELYRFVYTLPDGEEDIVKLDSVLFKINKVSNKLEPYIFNYSVDDNGVHKGEFIEEGTLAYDWMVYIRQGAKKYVPKDKVWVNNGSLTLIQWVLSLDWLCNNIVHNNSRVLGLAGSRQIGKSYLMKKFVGFLPVYLPKYVDLGMLDKYWVVLASYGAKSINKLFNEVKPEVEKAIDLFNKQNPATPLVYGNEGKKYGRNLSKNKDAMEIGMVINGELVNYSIMFAIGTNVISDGLSAHVLLCDESQYTPYEEFKKTEAFTSATGGCKVLFGIGSDDSASVSSHYYNLMKKGNMDIEFYRIPFPIVYGVDKYFDKKQAEIKFNEFYAKCTSWGGLQSLQVSLHYMSRFDSMHRKFMTRQYMSQQNLQSIEYIPNKPLRADYRTAGIDFATSGDYMVMTITDVYIKERVNEISGALEQTEHFELVDIHTLNLQKERISSTKSAHRCADLCRQYEVDMVMVDSTGTQGASATKVIEALRDKDINTLVVGFSFASTNKQNMMEYLEELFMTSSISLFNPIWEKQHKPYSILVKEMIDLLKEKVISKTGKDKTTYLAPDAPEFTDDHVMSLGLSVYCYKYVKKLIAMQKPIVIEDLSYQAYLNKFIKREVKKQDYKKAVKRYAMVF